MTGTCPSVSAVLVNAAGPSGFPRPGSVSPPARGRGGRSEEKRGLGKKRCPGRAGEPQDRLEAKHGGALGVPRDVRPSPSLQCPQPLLTPLNTRLRQGWEGDLEREGDAQDGLEPTQGGLLGVPRDVPPSQHAQSPQSTLTILRTWLRALPSLPLQFSTWYGGAMTTSSITTMFFSCHLQSLMLRGARTGSGNATWPGKATTTTTGVGLCPTEGAKSPPGHSSVPPERGESPGGRDVPGRGREPSSFPADPIQHIPGHVRVFHGKPEGAGDGNPPKRLRGTPKQSTVIPRWGLTSYG